MDFSFTKEQEDLRNEFEAFIIKEMKDAPPGWEGVADPYDTDEAWAFHRYMAKRLAEEGWLVSPWPKEYGGRDASPIDQLIYDEVLGYHNVPGVDILGVRMLGPAILHLGTEEQKEKHLLPIAKGDVMWCQGWSEPDAGSDLASLKTSAVLDGDYYRVNGQKIWTSGAHRADWIFLLVRTDPEEKRSKGLTFLLADMKTPGITVRPVPMMNGVHSFNEVFLDDVKIHVSDRLGDHNRGWDVTKAIMNFERSSVSDVAVAKRDLEDLVQYCKETTRNGAALIKDPVIRHRLADLAIEIEISRTLAYNIAWIREKGEILASMTPMSVAKVYSTEMCQHMAYTGIKILGPHGQVKGEGKWAALYGKFEQAYQLCMGMNLAGGSSEIQRNIITWTALQLPRV
ncbi:MAG: acyl-CoA dehydrogenase family protein [Desulfatiglans sp.]|jgi:alkylation response protein AidB-like acyl-CoA dehydrogenase|nr:acyl-CoA dehydrogenase family protein [Thermodesulfobacteriota bacterium]MEE4352065.1 acyl-CoA dehydrogenase family protein [Desulfatiglans sp.]